MAGREREISAAAFLPRSAHQSVEQLARAARECEGCELYRKATQTVFGEGAHDALVVFVGEQPGDQEDRAGRVLRRVAKRLELPAEAAANRRQTYD